MCWLTFVHQVIDANLDTAVTELLNQLAKFQTKLFEQDPVKAAQKRRFQCGLREVMKSAKRGKLKLVVIAPNIDKIEADGGLDDMVGDLRPVEGCQPPFDVLQHSPGRLDVC